MLTIPAFESVAIVSDNAPLVAQIASFFTRRNRYLVVLDGPRMTRQDWQAEVIRRSNAIAMAQVRRIVFADLPPQAANHLSRILPSSMVVSVTSLDDATIALKGWVKAPINKFTWGCNNLGVGLMLARQARRALETTPNSSSPTNFVLGGRDLLVVCEEGDKLAEVTAANFAFATGASLLVIPALQDDTRDGWLDELYELGSDGDASGRFGAIRDRVRQQLPRFEYEEFEQIMFVTGGFPWGIAVPERPTTHMYHYPDFGRSIVEGIWSSQDASRSARNALLVHPWQVHGSEIESIARSLTKNGTLVRMLGGRSATVSSVQTLIETLPFDLIVLSTHAGDIPGERITFEFDDSEGLRRRLVVDEAIGFGYDPGTEKVLVQEFHRFHQLDGVDWTNSQAKARLYVGTALLAFEKLGSLAERDKYKVAAEPIQRVRGSMGLQMHDHIWMPSMQRLARGCAPIIVNNACSSWHELGERFIFAGARAYIGCLFPVTELEAQEIGTAIFERQLVQFLPVALWAAQNSVYGSQGRRPYAVIGLPFLSIRRNKIDALRYMADEYKRAIAEYRQEASTSPYTSVRETSQRLEAFLSKDFQAFLSSTGS